MPVHHYPIEIIVQTGKVEEGKQAVLKGLQSLVLSQLTRRR